MSLFTIYSLRCQVCAYRFSAFYGHRQQPPRRSYTRLPVSYPVWFRLASEPEGSPSQEGRITNLSIRGCRIRSHAQVPMGSRLALEFQPSPYGFPITIDGAVVRSRADEAVGLRFVKLSRSEERRLGRVIDLYTPAPQG